MFENLTEKLERSFKIIKGQGRITEINIAETLKEVRRALLDADVSYRVAKDFCNDVKAKALGQNVLTAVRPDQMMIKIVHDELVTLMGSTASDINIKVSPASSWWPVSRVPVRRPSAASWRSTARASAASR